MAMVNQFIASFFNKSLYYFLKLFYSKIEGVNPVIVLATVFFMQKIVGINRMVPWPMHFTSRVLYRRKVKIGNRSFPGWSQGCYIQARNGIQIGHNLRMGPSVGLISSNHDLNDYDNWTKTGPIIIGDNVWIGMNTVVMPGVFIGNNAVIGANSVVTNQIPDNSIAVGNPCKVIKEKPPYKGKNYGDL